MNKKQVAGLIAIVSLVMILLANMVSAAQITDAFMNLFGNIGDNSREFFKGGYKSHQDLIGFLLLFILFTAIFMLGLKKAFSEEKASRQVKVIAVVLALMASLAIIIGTDFELENFKYIALGLLFLSLVVLIYSLLLKLGLEKHKFLAFILALLIAAFLAFLLGKLLSEGGWDLDRLKGWFERGAPSKPSKAGYTPGAIVPAGEGEGEGGVVGEGEGEGGVVGEGEGEGGVVGEGEGEGGGEEKRSWLWWLLPLLFIIILILYLRRQKKPKPVIPPEPPEVIETIKEKKEAVIRILELIKEKRKLIPKIADIGKKKPTEGGIYVDDSNSDESAYLGDKKEEASKKIRELKKDLKELANINKREESYLKDIVDIEKKVIEKYTKKGMQGEYGGYEGGYQGYVYEGGYDAYGPEGNKKIQELIKICNEIILIINEKLKGVLDEENKNMVNESELEETEQKLAERRKNLVWITKVLTAIDNIGKLWWNKDKTAVNKTEYYWISILYGRIKKQLRLMKEIEIPVTPPPAHIPIHNKEDAIKAFTEYFKTKDGIITELNRVPPKHPYEVMFGRLAEENEKAKGYIKELERIEKEYIAKYSAPEKKPHGEYTGSKEIRNL